MKKWIFIVALALAGCGAARPWTVPQDLSRGDVAKIVGDAAAHDGLSALLRHAEDTLLDSDEARMAELLRAALATGRLSETETETAEWMLHDVCERNAVDSIAADFRFATEEASENTLHTFRPGEPLVVLFYDPDCRHCRDVIAEMGDMKGLPTVLAVCVESSVKRWEQSRDGLPEGWVRAYDRSGVLAEDLYVIRQFPAIYLLDGERRVVIKNAKPCQLLK